MLPFLLFYYCITLFIIVFLLFLLLYKRHKGTGVVYASLNYYFQTVLTQRCFTHECFVCLQLFYKRYPFNSTIITSLKVPYVKFLD